ncbi:MAG TPA: sigma-70 family RNA polymerase sigma factor [Flavisolibacter sp.]|nr:sigma-70 family RNA polymerase sigma factor [Flavisolibacter sp.]
MQTRETALWESFTLGSREAFADLYKIYHPRLFNYGRKFTDNIEVIEDAIHDLFMCFWINKSLAEAKNIRSYLFVSFRNNLINKLREDHKGYLSFQADSYQFELDASIDQVMINREHLYEQHISLNKAVEKLTERQKEAVFLMFYEGMSYQEVADILQISVKGTYKLMARAISELKGSYEQSASLYLLSLPLFLFSFLMFL